MQKYAIVFQSSKRFTNISKRTLSFSDTAVVSFNWNINLISTDWLISVSILNDFCSLIAISCSIRLVQKNVLERFYMETVECFQILWFLSYYGSCSCESTKFHKNLDSQHFKKWQLNWISGQMAKLYTNSNFEMNKRINGYSTSNICCTCHDNRSINDTQIVRPITPTSIDIQIVPSMMGKTHRMLCTICPFYIVHIV